MRAIGFEPMQALSQCVSSEQMSDLSASHLTTLARPLKIINFYPYKKLYKYVRTWIFGDGHSSRAIPDPIPNSEVKPATPRALVSDKMRNTGAVFDNFLGLI